MINHPNRKQKISASANRVLGSIFKAKAKPKVSNKLAVPRLEHDEEYANFLAALQRQAFVNTGPIFQTDANGLYDMYLASLPADRQIHNCCACRRFIERFGGLVTVSEDGRLLPVLWGSTVPTFYSKAFFSLYNRVHNARITGVFYSKEKVWGTPSTPPWRHMAVNQPDSLVYRERALTPGQAMAAKRENYKTVLAALVEFKAPVLDQALRLFESDSVSRSEKFVGPVKWLRKLHDRPKGRLGTNILWREIALAPEGYCHPKASVLGPLLTNIAMGLPFADIKAQFEAMVQPLRYQRPQEAPKAGNLAAAEALVKKLGIERSLERRFATLQDMRDFIWHPLWHQTIKDQPTEGVFGHIKPRGAVPPQFGVDLPTQTYTWVKFRDTVLPNAEKIEQLIPGRGAFVALLTAVHADAPPILKWDHENERNPVSWYVYPHGSYAGQWKLQSGAWHPVDAIVPIPPMWGSHPMPQLSEGVVLILNGAVDTKESGNGLFPECLKSELHGARASIEAYSRLAKISGRDEASACGYDIRKGTLGRMDGLNCSLRVYVNGAWTRYKIDRWD